MWYISNVSIIFYCSMLLYYLFWMLMGLFIHFYIIFGTNLLTRGPAHIVVWLPVSVFWRKGISNRVQTEWNLQERYFWNKSDRESLECKSRKLRGPQEIGGRAPPRACPLPHGHLVRFLTSTPSPLDHVCSKNHAPEGFILFGLRLIFLFCETLQ